MIRIAVCDDNIEELNYVDHIMQSYCHEQYSCLDVQTFRTGFSLLNAIDCGMSFDIVLLDITGKAAFFNIFCRVCSGKL